MIVFSVGNLLYGTPDFVKFPVYNFKKILENITGFVIRENVEMFINSHYIGFNLQFTP